MAFRKTPLLAALVLPWIFLCSPLLGLGLLLIFLQGRNPRPKGWVRRRFQGDITWKAAMVFNSAGWGATFIATKACVDAVDGANINAAAFVGFVRFLLVTVPLLPWLPYSSNWESGLKSGLVGFIWGTSYACSLLAYSLGTTGAKAAFITALQSLVVAFSTSFVERRLRTGQASLQAILEDIRRCLSRCISLASQRS